MFFFQFHEDYLLIERQISPQAYLSFKFWEIEDKVGRLCQFLQIYVQKITATK